MLLIVSHESLCWTIKSLKKDEMSPTYKAIQSRMKEAFAFKASLPTWELILNIILNLDKQSSETLFLSKEEQQSIYESSLRFRFHKFDL